MAELMLHAGGHLATMDELRAGETLRPEGRWHPVAHSAVLDAAKETLHGAGYIVRAEKYALARNDTRFFGVLDLATPLTEGAAISVGGPELGGQVVPARIRRRQPGVRLRQPGFRSELLVRSKHSLNGMKAFGTAISGAVASHATFKEIETLRIKTMAEMELTPAMASHIILSAYRHGIISTSQPPKVCLEWEELQHVDFMPQTAWSLFNVFTEVMKVRSITTPHRFVAQTIRLNGLILPAAETAPHLVA